MRRASGVRQLGQAPSNSTGQAGAGDGTGQLPGKPQLGQCQRALLQQVQAAVVIEFIRSWLGLAPAWGGPSRGHLLTGAGLSRPKTCTLI